VLWAREKISQKMRASRGTATDVKRHRGGIRDIEFLTQCLQRLVGRHDPWVRSGGTLLALRNLNDKGWLSDIDYAALTSAYEFFRRVEHRIQLEAGHQTHRLPVEPASLDRLARRVGIECGGDERPGQALMRQLQQKFQRVDEIYQRVIHPRPGVETDLAFQLRPPNAVPLEGAHSYESIQRYLDAHAPELASVLREVSPSVKARRNTLRFFTALLSSSERFRLAREQPHAVRRALEVLGANEYLADLLIHHPEEMVVLDSGPGVAPARALADVGEHVHGAPATESDREGREGPPLRGRTQRLASQQELGLETSEDAGPFGWARGVGLGIREKMALLRRNYRARILELGAADWRAGVQYFRR
jgi:glutamine synthetase adenylyltransferase